MTLQTTRASPLNPYAAPRARVDDPTLAAPEPVFFPVSLLKLALMSLVTLNLYEIYWFYQNWKCVQRLDDEKVNAPIRAFFYPVTSYSLFRRIQAHAPAYEIDTSLQAGALAAAVFAFAMLWRLPDPYWLAAFLGFLPLLPVQAVVNRINRKFAPEADPNRRFRGWNIVALVLGGALLFLAIVGTFLDPS